MITIYYSRARERELQQIDEPRAGSWIVASELDSAQRDSFAKTYKLDRDMLEDANDIYEAPRVEVEDGVTYIFTRYCHPEGKEIATEPLLLVYTTSYLITVSRIGTTLVDRLTADTFDTITTQKTKTLLRIFKCIILNMVS